MKILRPPSLHNNVFYGCWKFGECKYDIKQDIHVQKIKGEKPVKISLFPYFYMIDNHYSYYDKENTTFHSMYDFQISLV